MLPTPPPLAIASDLFAPGYAWVHFMSPFDFSQFNSAEKTRKVELLGLTEDQLKLLLQDQHGLSKALIEHYPDICTRSHAPTAVIKSGIIWEHYDRDCSYATIAEGLRREDQAPPAEDTVYQHMIRYRKLVDQAFGLKIENHNGRVYLVTRRSVAERAERLERRLSSVKNGLEDLSADIASLRASGDEFVLPGTAGALLRGYEEAKRLEASVN